MNIYNLLELLTKALPLALTSNNVTVGFKYREIFPFDTEFNDNEIFVFGLIQGDKEKQEEKAIRGMLKRK